jgi:acyl transferase domain-containing protein
LLAFSARHQESLKSAVEKHRSYLTANPSAAQDMAYSLAAKREQLSHRSFAIFSPKEGFEPSRITKVNNHSKLALVYVFTGQGAQWASMGRELLDNNRVFRNTMSHLEECLKKLENPPNWTLSGMFYLPKMLNC